MPKVVRSAPTDEELAEVGVSKKTVRQAPTAEELAEARGQAAPAAVDASREPSTGRALVEGALQGGTYGFGDEIQGALGAFRKRDPIAKALGAAPSPEDLGEENIFSPSGHGYGVAEDYARERNAARVDRDAAKSAHPTAYNTGQIVAALLSPGPKGGKTIASFGKAGAKAGGAYALGASDADLTKGEFGRAALDTAEGLLLGGGIGLGGGLLSKYALQPLAEKAADFGRRAFQKAAEKADKPIDAAINSAGAKLGGTVAAGRSTMSNLRADAVNPELPEDLSRRAGELLSDDMAKALDERVARSTQAQFFQRLPAVEKAQTGLDESLAKGTPELRAAARDALLNKSPMTTAILKNLARIGLPALGFTADKLMGGSGAVGGGLGLVTGQLSGRPLTLLTNAAKTPAFQRSAAQLGERVVGEMVPGAIQGMTAEQAGNPQSTTRNALQPYIDLLEREPKK